MGESALGILPSQKSVRIAWGASFGLSLLLLSLPWLVKLDGHPHADWQQFLGRFHPLAVHLPIGLLVLVPLLEGAGAMRPALREAAGFVLALAFASCLFALTLGFLLAYGGGTSGTGVTRHLWGGIVLTIVVLMCLLARPQWCAQSAAYTYPALLACMLIALVWTADQGGSITHGSTYLTQYMPAGMKARTGFRTYAVSLILCKTHSSHSPIRIAQAVMARARQKAVCAWTRTSCS